MAQTRSGATAPKQKTAAAMSQWERDHERELKNYTAAMNPLKTLRDVTKQVQKKVRSLTKENIIVYLQNPIANEKNLRNAAWYIFFRNQIFQILILYYATLFCLDARIVIPRRDPIHPESDDEILRSYYETLKMLSNWNIDNEFLKTNITCMLQDVSYNCAYHDSTGLYLLPLPADYCKIYGQYSTGDHAFKMDMAYFRGTNEWLIEEWGEPFITMWREYNGDNAKRWQKMPDKYAACFKYRNYDETVIPPFSGILGELINLNDVEDNQALADAAEVYKLIYLKLQTISGAKMMDEWRINPDVSIEYFQRLINEALPDYMSAAVVPTDDDLGVIDFSSTDKTGEVNKVLKAEKAILNTAGGAQILNSAEISGTTAFNAAIKADTERAIATLLPQIEGWFNRIIEFDVKRPSKIKFFHIGRLTRDDLRKELLEDAQYSLPSKLAIMSVNGFDPLDILALNHLEENILNLGEKFNDPLKSSYTSSYRNGGRPSLDDGEISDDGEASKEKRDRANE